MAETTDRVEALVKVDFEKKPPLFPSRGACGAFATLTASQVIDTFVIIIFRTMRNFVRDYNKEQDAILH